MATTNDKKIAEKMMIYRTNGITKDRKLFKNKKNFGPWYYEQHECGYNYRMNDIAAALGISQLKRVNQFVNKRNFISKLYKKILKDTPIECQKINTYNFSSYHLFIIKINLKKFKFSYNKIFNLLRAKKYFINLHYMPLHLSPYFKKRGFKKNDFPIAENFAKSAISIPVYNDLKINKIYEICRTIKSFVK